MIHGVDSVAPTIKTIVNPGPDEALKARCVMVLGTSSGAGKSWLVTALCRHWANQGLRVAPFKAQNMSNNARVVAGPPQGENAAPLGGSAPRAAGERGGQVFTAGPPQGENAAPLGGSAPRAAGERGGHFFGEIGAAQYFQALAARAVPEVRMNPLLLKPEADTRSQAVLLGRVSHELTALPWRERGARVWPHIAAALDALRAENDVVVIEGAGSPAEINLMASDIVNLRVARHAQARCLLVADIDRGGAFAHLYGTWALLPEADRALLRGFVLNKFRGDATLLAPAPQMLEEKTGLPTLAIIPMDWHHGLPEEDGLFDAAARSGGGPIHTTVAVLAWPRISNLDEFQPLKNLPGVRLVWARDPAQLAELDAATDWVVLPGSKATVADLAWLRTRGLDAAVAAHAARGGRVLGICGGLQMLGEALIDLHGIEAASPPRPQVATKKEAGATVSTGVSGDFQHDLETGNAPGLGLLPLVTAFAPQKTVRHTTAQFGPLAGPWQALGGVTVRGYEIHHGQSVQHPGLAARGERAREVIPGLAWQNAAGNVLGLYLHGLLEDPAALRALFGAGAATLDDVFERLATRVARHFSPGALDALLQA